MSAAPQPVLSDCGSDSGPAPGLGTGERRVVVTAAFLRAVATGMAGVLLGIYLAELGLTPATVGLVAGAGLAGAAAGALAVTLWGRRWESRRPLLVFGLLAAAGGALMALASHPLALAAAAFLGMVNGMGRDRGPASVLEQAMIPATTGPAGRTAALAWYTALQDVGHAVGSLAAGLPVLLAAAFALGEERSFRLAIGLYALLMATSTLLYLRLPARRSETEIVGSAGIASPAPARLSPRSRRVVTRLSLLFALDGLGGGFLVTALLSYFFFERFGVGAAALGLLFFAGRAANVLSHFGAAWLARRIGLVNTMVWTHLPSSLLLVAVAFAPSFALAAALYLLRESLVEMDVPTRQSYVLAVVRPEERTTAAGVTNLVRLGTWALGPMLAGWMMGGLALAAPLLAGAGLKVVYDLLLYASFRRLRPPEEQESEPPATAALATNGGPR
ncbi:MAG TPA: MFS transporter [Thermoanaerobaculia bacterium]|nr:MFS transporter [Thermoanaerobaculia bacterium]